MADTETFSPMQKERERLETSLQNIFPSHSFRIYLDDTKDGYYIPTGDTAQQQQQQQEQRQSTTSEPIALYRVEERSSSGGRRGEIVALGLYVHSGAEGCGEEQIHRICVEATRIKMDQGRAAVGAPMKTVGLLGGVMKTGTYLSVSDSPRNRATAVSVTTESEGVWDEHQRRLEKR